MLPFMTTLKCFKWKNSHGTSITRKLKSITSVYTSLTLCISCIMYRRSSIFTLFMCLYSHYFCACDLCMDFYKLRLEIRERIGEQNQFIGLLTANSVSRVGFSTLKVNEQPVEGRGRHLLSLQGRTPLLPNARRSFVFGGSQTAGLINFITLDSVMCRAKARECKMFRV